MMTIQELLKEARKIWEEEVKKDPFLRSEAMSELQLVRFAIRCFAEYITPRIGSHPIWALSEACKEKYAIRLGTEAAQPDLQAWQLLPIFGASPKVEEIGSSARSDSTVTAL